MNDNEFQTVAYCNNIILSYLRQSKYTALILAARYGKTEVCQLLLSKGADVNSQTKVKLYYFMLQKEEKDMVFD